MSQARYDRLQTLKAQAAAQFELPVDSERVSIIAGLRLHQEQLQERMYAGKGVSTADLLEIAKAIVDVSPAPQRSCEIVIVDGIFTVSPRCGHRASSPPKAELPSAPKPSPADVVHLKSPLDGAV
jgi:hypothetical protein